MASYFSTKEEAVARIKELQPKHGKPAFFGKVLNNNFGTEQWMVDYEKRDYGAAFTVLENLTHEPRMGTPAVTQMCTQCKTEFDARMFTCPKCGCTESSIAGGIEAIEIMALRQKAVEISDSAMEPFNAGKLGLSEAIAAVREALTINPMYELAHSNLGFLLIAGGNFKEAVRTFEHVLSFSPHRSDAQRGLAMAKSMLGEASSPPSSISSTPQTRKMWWQFWK